MKCYSQLDTSVSNATDSTEDILYEVAGGEADLIEVLVYDHFVDCIDSDELQALFPDSFHDESDCYIIFLLSSCCIFFLANCIPNNM